MERQPVVNYEKTGFSSQNIISKKIFSPTFSGHESEALWHSKCFISFGVTFSSPVAILQDSSGWHEAAPIPDLSHVCPLSIPKHRINYHHTNYCCLKGKYAICPGAQVWIQAAVSTISQSKTRCDLANSGRMRLIRVLREWFTELG